MTLQLAGRSIKHPMGIVEDVQVKIGKFFIPFDFVVTDIAEESLVPIILGRPLLHTAEAVIEVRHGGLTFNIGDDTITFGLDKTSCPPDLKASCHMTLMEKTSIASVVKGLLRRFLTDVYRGVVFDMRLLWNRRKRLTFASVVS
ncbi:uncharacterized protein LOC141627619 [Silene latifolia]|uniref:uncharacterized protein LOC141627619 n=1 Tax=Silene latifolia TaxID=37657 RepID=UPI003D77A41E